MVIGFAIFAIFFGAGNFVFPPMIGVAAGSAWKTAILGLAISGILLPFLTVIALDNAGGDHEKLFAPVAPWFASAYSVAFIIMMLTIGPPRQAAVAIETGVYGAAPGLIGKEGLRIAMLAVYFVLVHYLSLNPTKIVDVIGKVLTPFLLISLSIIVIFGILHPMGVPVEPRVRSPFMHAFTQAYQTGDVCVGIVLVSTFIASVKEKGYTEAKERRSVLLQAAVIALLCLLFVYGGLLYLGASSSVLFSTDVDPSALLISIIYSVSGRFGSVVLGVGIFFACLTSSIGMQTIMAQFTEKLSRGKLPYRRCLLVYNIISFGMACMGVANIIRYTTAIFALLYPIAIAATLLGVFRRFVPNHGAWKGAILMAGLVGLYEAVLKLNGAGVTHIHIAPLQALYARLPLSAYGIGWLLPAAIGCVVGALIVAIKRPKALPLPEEAPD